MKEKCYQFILTCGTLQEIVEVPVKLVIDEIQAKIFSVRQHAESNIDSIVYSGIVDVDPEKLEDNEIFYQL